MAADLEVTTESIAALKNSFEAETNSLVAGLKEMKASIDGLNATWEGPNQGIYILRFTVDYQKLEDTIKDFQECVNVLDTVYKKYEATESEAGNIASRI